MDDTFDYLDDAWQVSSTTMIVTSAQVGVLALAVLAMLVSVALIQRRPEVGLSRLRGRSFGSLVRSLAAQWTAVVIAGAALGIAAGFGAAALARALWLSGPPPLSPPGWVVVALGLAVLAAILLLVLMARPVVREPVPALLRSTGPRSAGPGDSRLLIDGALITAAVCGLIVGLQSSDDSALVLLAPSLLAVAASVLLVRALAWAAGRLAVRWLTRGHTTWALTGVLIARGRGTRLLLTVLCMTAAFLVFSSQLSTVAQANRTHRAEIEAGAVAVGRTDAPAAQVAAALDAVDPTASGRPLVVSTAPSGPDAVGTLYVEPDAFTRLAFGALDAAPESAWERDHGTPRAEHPSSPGGASSSPSRRTRWTPTAPAASWRCAWTTCTRRGSSPASGSGRSRSSPSTRSTSRRRSPAPTPAGSSAGASTPTAPSTARSS